MAKKRRTEQPSDQQSETLLWSVLCIQPFCMSWHGTVLLYNAIAIELQFNNIVFVVCTSDPDGSDQQPCGTHVTYYSMQAVNSQARQRPLFKEYIHRVKLLNISQGVLKIEHNTA